MSKDPSPRADALRAQREARYGHAQARVTEEKSSDVMKAVAPMMKPAKSTKPPRKRVKYKRKTS